MIGRRVRSAVVAALVGLAVDVAVLRWRRRHDRPAAAMTDLPTDQPVVPAATPAPTPAIASARQHPRLRRLVLVPLDVALVAALVLVVFVGYGMVGNRWYRVIAIEGGSMEPTIMRGDLIVLTPAPARVQPGMVLVLGVDGRIVTHRVVAVRPDGSLVTKGDANNTDDDWAGHPITVYGQYQFRIPELGQFLPVKNASGATFADTETGTQRIRVAWWPTPPLAATVRIEPETVSLGNEGGGQVSVFVDRLPAPHSLAEIDPASVTLCLGDTCVASGGAKRDGIAHVRATFSASAFAALVGEDCGRLTFTVQGSITGYGPGFAGNDSVRVISCDDNAAPADGIAPAAPPSPDDAAPPMPGDTPVAPSPAATPSAAPPSAEEPPAPVPDAPTPASPPDAPPSPPA